MPRPQEVKPLPTYDELLTEWFQTFGYFANQLHKPYEEVSLYFRKRAEEQRDVVIMGVYVRRNVIIDSTKDVKVRR